MQASRTICLLLVLVAASLFATACGGGGSEESSITVGLPTAETSFANSDVVVAQQQGFFEDQGLQVELQNFGSGLKVVQAVVSGDVQVGGSSIEPVVNASAQGGQLPTGRLERLHQRSPLGTDLLGDPPNRASSRDDKSGPELS